MKTSPQLWHSTLQSLKGTPKQDIRFSNRYYPTCRPADALVFKEEAARAEHDSAEPREPQEEAGEHSG